MAAIVVVTTAIAQAHGAFTGHASLIPYLCGYGVAAILLGIAAVMAMSTAKQERLAESRREHGTNFVLEATGTQPLSSVNSDWKFLLTNCGECAARYVRIDPIRSEIGTYDIFFSEIPVLQPGQPTVLNLQVHDRRHNQLRKSNPTLWDFGIDNAGERGTSYFWYNIHIKYRDTDDSERDGGEFGVCFDLQNDRLLAGKPHHKDSMGMYLLEG